MALDAVDNQGGAKITRRLLARFYLRFHISLILLWSFGAGLLANKAMFWAGADSMLLRYPLALLVSYGAFFLGVRIWLAYVGAEPLAGGSRGSSLLDVPGNSGGLDLSAWKGGDPGGAVHGGGGDFGGGGASASFASDADSIGDAAADAGAAPLRSGSWFSLGRSGGGSGGGVSLDLGDGDGWLVILLLVLIAALLSSIFGVVIYLVYSAPSVLADVAFQAMLAGGLVKHSRRWRDSNWEMRLFQATWVPFLIVFVLAVASAALAVKLFPGAHTLPDVIHAALDALPDAGE